MDQIPTRNDNSGELSQMEERYQKAWIMGTRLPSELKGKQRKLG